MQTEKITILGFSEATIAMILDILESNEDFVDIEIVNNLDIIPKLEYNVIEKKSIVGDERYFLLGSAKTSTRLLIRRAFENLDTKNFIKLISNKSYVSSTTYIGKGTIICPNVSISAHSNIGNFVFVNRGATIGHHTKIGDFTSINPGANIAGNVIIGEKCQIGMGANIIDGIKIGNNTIIGAGSVVTKDIPANVVAYGSPCKIIKDIN
jgi:sugar O-acyltransferase (sialic acid O-acetyltransferase NeuD family)